MLCSVYCLPDNPFKRHRLIQNAIENNIKIAFANEDFVLENKEDFNLVNNWFTFLGDMTRYPSIWIKWSKIYGQ